MKTLHFDLAAGISGDMALGALVHLGADPDLLRGELAKLGLSGWKLDFADDERGGIHGLHAVVDLAGETDHIARDGDEEDAEPHHHHYEHEHNHDERHHDDAHDHGHEHSHEHNHNERHHDGAHTHRAWREIRELIETSGIREGAKKRALAIFTRIARAEAEVHGTPVDEVEFHEVGALDSIIDVVGTAICLDMLNPDRITAGEIELGGGMVKCAHGILPVPAPAVLILCRGLPVKTGGFNKEMTTPTGAAILAASVDEFITTARFTELKTGYGIGTRKLEKPNLLRVSWREEAGALPSSDYIDEDLVLMETTIDDMTGEALAFLMERLFEAGALDVTFSPVTMKKSRPGTVVAILAPPEKLESLRSAVFTGSTTIGLRELPVRRLSLRREAGKLSGDFGEARTKTVFLDGKPLRGKIEFEDRARVARERGVSLAEAEKIIENGGKPARAAEPNLAEPVNL
jgi:uncharacterized protein (TIGR00299 family) protein